MKVIHLCHQDGAGGAAVAAARLHRALLGLGLDSSLFVARRVAGYPATQASVPAWQARWLPRLDRLPRHLLKTSNRSLISPAWVGSPVWRSVNRARPDFVHLHWICQGFLRIEALRRFQSPLVWSLHDMWPFAGGEHYVEDCVRYRDGYLPHNRPAHESGFDLNRWIWRRKAQAWARLPQLTLFAVSQWLADRAGESALFRDRRIEVLHNAIDPADFNPQDQRAARRLLRLPPDAPLVAFGAVDATSDRRKGFDLLQRALSHVHATLPGVELVVFGNAPGARGEGARSKIHFLGRVDEPRRLAAVYAAADVMVVPSREESFGQTALEALACGTPVAAFRIGGLPEVVEHETSGYLARPFDAADLAYGIHWLLLQRKTRGPEFAQSGLERVKSRFTLEVQAARCRDLYERLEEAADRAVSP